MRQRPSWLVVGSADDGCSEYLCTSCRARWQGRYVKACNYCPTCGMQYTKTVIRKDKQYFPSTSCNDPIQDIHWEIWVGGNVNERDRPVYRTSKYHRAPRTDVLQRIAELREGERQFCAEHSGYAPARHWIRKAKL